MKTIKNVCLYRDADEGDYEMRFGDDEDIVYPVPEEQVVEITEDFGEGCFAGEINVFDDEVVEWIRTNDIFELDEVDGGFEVSSRLKQ